MQRRTQAQLVAMKKEIIETCLSKEMKWKQGAKLLKMHPKAFSRLKKRYIEEGESALISKKPGPKKGTAWNKTKDDIEDIVIKIAWDHMDLGPKPLSDELETLHNIVLHPTTIWRILKRRNCRYRKEYVKKQRKEAKLYCLDTPGEELQMDGCYPYGRSRKLVSFDAIDDCTRFVWGRCYDRETAENAIKFVTELVSRAPFRVQRIRVDNRYGKVFKSYCETILGIEVIANDPYCPQQNGKIERFHRTLKDGFFRRYGMYRSSMDEINCKYQQWLDYYNYDRKHTGLGMNGLKPAQKLASNLLFSTALTLKYESNEKVTGTLQQYKT